LFDIFQPWADSPKAAQGVHTLPFRLSDFPSHYQLKLSKKRRSVALEISNSELTVRAPLRTPIGLIEQFLIERKGWIVQKLTKQQQLPQRRMYFRDGDQFLLRGQSHVLRVIRASRYSCQLQDKELIICVPHRVIHLQNYVKSKFIEFLTAQIEAYSQTKLPELTANAGLKPKSVEFKVYKSRWGCCYSNGTIRLNPLLISAPDRVIDCVITHELCHLKHMDHSAAFWRMNKKVCGYCDETNRWLRQFHLVISLH
jgi:hypothetical protein